ncbi:MAG TPA: transposase [Phycisphaerae bacterium]|nr:transposase [Phycisphaerae bacterium]
MPRVARIVIPGVPHHVTQRGNNRQDVFFVDDDRRAYLDLLAEQADRFGLTVLGYCLMGNHVHLVAVPAGEQSLARAVGRTHFLYTQYVNRLQRRSGHLWQNRFFSCALDDAHLWNALVYVERNPVRARVVRAAWNYPWSSAAAHAGRSQPHTALDMAEWRAVWTPGKWREQLIRPDDAKELAGLRLSTHRGRPLGSDSFLSKLEHRLGRRLRPLPAGRPRKKAKIKTAAGRRKSRRREDK